MKKIIGILFFCTFWGVLTVSAQKTDQCFENKGLKQHQIVSFTVTGTKLTGTFEASAYDDATPGGTFEFTGTKTGNLLTIKFKDKVPYELPPRTKKIVWTLSKTGLKIPTFGKNYDTNKFSAYTATYEKCGEI